jgi:hypothetical protein
MRSDTNSSVRTLALPFPALQLRHLFLNFSPVYIVGTEGYRSLSIFWLKLNRYKLKLFSHDFMKKILILLLLLIVAMAVGWNAFNQEQPLSVTTITPERGVIEESKGSDSIDFIPHRERSSKSLFLLGSSCFSRVR